MSTPRVKLMSEDVMPDHWTALPRLATIGGFTIRDLRPLVDTDEADKLTDMTEAAVTYLRACHWEELLDEGGEPFDARGRRRSYWTKAFERAIARLAEESTRAGMESEPERWASWLCYEVPSFVRPGGLD